MSTQRKYVCRRQGRVAAEVIFHHRCEPAQVKISVRASYHKGRFAVAVLRCDFLHDGIGRKCRNNAYSGRIACKQFVRKGINLVVGNWHVAANLSQAKTGNIAIAPTIRVIGCNLQCGQTAQKGNEFDDLRGGVTDVQIHCRRRRQLPALGCSCPGNRPFTLALIPRRFCCRPRPLERRYLREHSIVCHHLDPLRRTMRSLCSGPCRASCALVLCHRGSDGHRCHNSQLEQGLAALVLVVLVAHLAGQLLDWSARWAPGLTLRLSSDKNSGSLSNYHALCLSNCTWPRRFWSRDD